MGKGASRSHLNKEVGGGRLFEQVTGGIAANKFQPNALPDLPPLETEHSRGMSALQARLEPHYKSQAEGLHISVAQLKSALNEFGAGSTEVFSLIKEKGLSFDDACRVVRLDKLG